MPTWSTSRVGSRTSKWSLERNLSRVEGERHLKARNWPEAEECLAEAVADADRRGHSVQKIHLRLQLAEAQRKQSKVAEAELTVRAALEHTARVSNPSGYVQCLDALAEVFHDAENFPSMEVALQEGVRIEAAMPHPDPLRMARRVHRLGTARHKNGRSVEAIPALEKALKLHEQVALKDGEKETPEHDIETANLLSELGSIQRAQGNYEVSHGLLRRALRIHETRLGHDSEEAMRDLHLLAGSLEEAGDIDGAAELYERTLLRRQRMVGGNLEDLAEMQYGLAGMYIGWSNYARSRELLAEAIGIFRRHKNARLAVAYETLAHVEECSGRYQEAIEQLARAGKTWEACGTERVHELAENLEHRAELLEQLRKKSEASWLRERAAKLSASATAAS
ncbi:MAG TPA: tetratricopeptide repeat protein [Bryobacteraceae bacterium]|nr:tetratricopeptide repeat protein [Bryobacteraceae bacterium]